MVQSVVTAQAFARAAPRRQPERGQGSEATKRITAIHHFLSDKYESRGKAEKGQQSGDGEVKGHTSGHGSELAAFPCRAKFILRLELCAPAVWELRSARIVFTHLFHQKQFAELMRRRKLATLLDSNFKEHCGRHLSCNETEFEPPGIEERSLVLTYYFRNQGENFHSL